MNNASIDVDARRTFREELRGRRVALRSFIPRDDIDDVEIVEAEDPEVSATRQVLKVELGDASATPAVERTGEIDALDVLESIDIVQERATPTNETAPMGAMLASSAPSVLEERAPYAALDVEDDAFFPQTDSPSTGPVTFHLGDSYVDEIGPTVELHGTSGTSPDERRRRLGWIVGTVIACAAVMAAAAAITAQTQSASSETAAFTAQAPRGAAEQAPRGAAAPTSPTASIALSTTAYPSIPELDVRSLPAALAGTIIGVPKHPLFVDGRRLQSSTAIVACGKHTVKSGAFRAAHVIDVPCGGTIALK
jgi:hypothetical protein